MNQASVTKERKCKSCGQQFYVTAQGLTEHYTVCARAAKVGLVLPTVERPKVKIIRLDEQD